MALTDHCDVFAAVNESAARRLLAHVTQQRPALFNYATASVIRRGELCAPVDAHVVALARGDRLVTEVPRLPVLLSETRDELEWCLQLTGLGVDVHPGGALTLPAELDPLGAQRVALQASACFGLGCPGGLEDLLPPGFGLDLRPGALAGLRGLGRPARDVPGLGRPKPGRPRPTRDPRPIPYRKLTCVCLEVDAVASVDFTGPAADQRLRGTLDGIEVVDLAPAGLENALECYAELVVRLGLLPRLALVPLRLTADLLGLATVSVRPTPASAEVPANPALESDELRLLVDIVSGPGSGGGPPPGGGGGGGGGALPPPAHPGVPRERTRSGPFDAVAALSERAVEELFAVVRDGVRIDLEDSFDSPPLVAGYEIEAHLERGTFEMGSDGAIALRELDIAWDKLAVSFGIDLPELCLPGFCVVPDLITGGCAVGFEPFCLFGGTADLGLDLDLGGLLVSELSIVLKPLVRYSANPDRPAGIDDWAAHDLGVPDHWQLMIDLIDVDVDFVDVADSIGDVLADALEAALDGLLAGLDQWVKDLVRALLGPLIDLVRVLLDLGDDLQEGFKRLLGVGLGLVELLELALRALLAGVPLLQFDNPVPLLEAEGDQMAVLVPIDFLGVRVEDTELVLEVDVGD